MLGPIAVALLRFVCILIGSGVVMTGFALMTYGVLDSKLIAFISGGVVAFAGWQIMRKTFPLVRYLLDKGVFAC